MVSARIEIYDTNEADAAKKYVLFYIVDGFEPIPMVIGNKLHYDKIVTLKELIKENGGANHIKKEVLLGNIEYRDGVYLI